jgi:hypothetical protein
MRAVKIAALLFISKVYKPGSMTSCARLWAGAW